MREKIVFIDSGSLSGAAQMQIDERLAREFLSSSVQSLIDADAILIRFYGWSPPAISLGYNQKETDFDKAKLATDGIDLVRRPTGGRAVFHIDEITYSVVCHATKRNAEHYADINLALKTGLEQLGVATVFQKQQPNFRAHYERATGVPCFTASARHELEIDGKKLAGSAQRKFGDVLLQHGSLMLTPKHRDLPNYLATSDEIMRDAVRKELIEKTISVSEILGRVPSYIEMRDALKCGFEQVYHTAAQELPHEELKDALSKISSLYFEQ
jgi:lipoyl(octanoyl) transferase